MSFYSYHLTSPQLDILCLLNDKIPFCLIAIESHPFSSAVITILNYSEMNCQDVINYFPSIVHQVERQKKNFKHPLKKIVSSAPYWLLKTITKAMPR